jgi:hypothetical protein
MLCEQYSANYNCRSNNNNHSDYSDHDYSRCALSLSALLLCIYNLHLKLSSKQSFSRTIMRQKQE